MNPIRELLQLMASAGVSPEKSDEAFRTIAENGLGVVIANAASKGGLRREDLEEILGRIAKKHDIKTDDLSELFNGLISIASCLMAASEQFGFRLPVDIKAAQIVTEPSQDVQTATHTPHSPGRPGPRAVRRVGDAGQQPAPASGKPETTDTAIGKRRGGLFKGFVKAAGGEREAATIFHSILKETGGNKVAAARMLRDAYPTVFGTPITPPTFINWEERFRQPVVITPSHEIIAVPPRADADREEGADKPIVHSTLFEQFTAEAGGEKNALSELTGAYTDASRDWDKAAEAIAAKFPQLFQRVPSGRALEKWTHIIMERWPGKPGAGSERVDQPVIHELLKGVDFNSLIGSLEVDENATVLSLRRLLNNAIFAMESSLGGKFSSMAEFLEYHETNCGDEGKAANDLGLSNHGSYGRLKVFFAPRIKDTQPQQPVESQ